MTDKPKIWSIEITFAEANYPGKRLLISSQDIEKIEVLGEAMSILERAKRVYEELKPLFQVK